MEDDQNQKAAPEEGTTQHDSWTSGENSMTNMSDEERKRHLGYTPGPGEPSLEEREKKSEANYRDEQSDKEAAD